MEPIHKNLASGAWHRLSLMEQMANIGSEVSRSMRWQGKDAQIFNGAAERALELFDLTLADERWRGRWREISRARELFCDALEGGKEYGTSLEDMDRYFMPFAFAARRHI